MWKTVWVDETSTFKLPEYTWDKDRKLCEQCRHYTPVENKETSHGDVTITMLCNLNARKRGNIDQGTCLDMRTEGKCGKAGVLFERN